MTSVLESRGTTWTWWREASAAVADLGVLVPLAVVLVVGNGLSATAVLLPVGLTYLLVSGVYRVPVAVQPLKAFAAVAIAAGAGVDVIASGALIMGVLFLVLGATGVLDRVARVFPVAVVRGVQLAVGLTFVRIAWGLVAHPPGEFGAAPTLGLAIPAAVLLTAALLRWPRRLVLVVVVIALVAAFVTSAGSDASPWGPSAITVPHLSIASLATAATLLVLPQVPLTFTNSCLAPADAARVYFGERARTVTPGRLARTLGVANLLVAAVGGMPVCHGAGGMSAHYSCGGRTWRTPALIGGALVLAALVGGAGLARVLTGFPLVVLGALLLAAAVAHVRLLTDLRGSSAWVIAIGVGVIGFLTTLGWAVVGGVLVHLAVDRWRRSAR